MPIYTWKCFECERVVDVERSIEFYKDEPDDPCTQCGERSWKRVIYPPKLQPITDGDRAALRDQRINKAGSAAARSRRGQGRVK